TVQPAAQQSAAGVAEVERGASGQAVAPDGGSNDLGGRTGDDAAKIERAYAAGVAVDPRPHRQAHCRRRGAHAAIDARRRCDRKSGPAVAKHLQAATARVHGRNANVCPITPGQIAFRVARAAEAATVRRWLRADDVNRAVGLDERDVGRQRVAGELAQRLSIAVGNAVGEPHAIVLPQRVVGLWRDERAAWKELLRKNAYARVA